MKTFEGGLDRFVEKQRRMMVQEGMAAVTLSRGGVELTKPFYFVLEKGAYRLNVARPGFSRPLAGGAGAASSYLVDNRASSWAEAWCEGGGYVAVPPNSSKYVSCPNRCGYWFAGARFDGTGWGGQTHLCDYNTWGADVINSPTYPYWGTACNDPC